MPIYHNATTTTLLFDLGGESYLVPPSHEVEVPRQYEYAIKGRGLLLAAGRAPTPGAPQATPVPVVSAPQRLPGGVVSGLPRARREAEEAEPDDDAAGDGDLGAPVAAAVADLVAKGVKLPKGSGRG